METLNRLGRCPERSILPAPPPGKMGWPWTEETPQLPDTMENGLPWPRISVVTPSYNQGQYLEETIRSVLLQGYPNLEYMVIDGGSTDHSVEIIKKYAPWLTCWTSEPDRGQAHAINKGLALATGELFNWINSDDFLAPEALGIIARASAGCDMVAGANILFGMEKRERILYARGLTARGLLRRDPDSELQQMAMWVRRSNLEISGVPDEEMHYAFDSDFYIRYLHLFPSVHYVNAPLGWYRKHEAAKTVASKEKFIPERLKTIEKLREDPRFQALHQDWEYATRKYRWWLQLAEIVNTPSTSGFRRGLRVLAKACADPSIRWDRITRRAVKKLLLGREIRPYAAAR